MAAGFSETIKRILVAMVGIPIVLSALFYFPDSFAVICLVAAILMGLELLSIIDTKSIRTYPLISIGTIVLLSAISIITFSHSLAGWVGDYLPGLLNLTKKNSTILFGTPPVVVLLIVSLFIIFTVETFQIDFSKTIETISGHLLVVIYCGVTVSFIIQLAYLNPYYLLLVWLVTWMTDSGAYFAGKYLGKTKLNFKVSPNKTLEGFIGGILTAILSGVILIKVFPNQFPETVFLFNYPGIILLGFVISIVTIFGDLAESLLKRSSGVKDSKTYIPGHGGLLDVMDSLLYTAPLFYFVVMFF